MDPTDLVAEYGSPCYVYDLDRVRERARALRAAIAYPDFVPLYALKANPCPAVVRVLVEEGYGIDAVSPGELAMARRLGVAPERILYTENNMTDAEMAGAVEARVLVNCGSLERLRRLGAAGVAEAAVRFNPDVGGGEHAHVLTAGPRTKFGVHHGQVEEVLRIGDETGIRVVGAHMHVGSNILDAEVFATAIEVLLRVAERLPHLRFVDFGGGLGVPYREDDPPLDLARLGELIDRRMREFSTARGGTIEAWLEPGRFLVAEAGTLYTTVSAVKTRPPSGDDPGRVFVGCDSGFNHLVRPCMYGSYHPVRNCSREGGETVVDVVGNICESGDVFARDRRLALPEPGDVLAIGCAGAYGMSMASTYNLRPLPAEVAIEGGRARPVRRRQTVDELLDAWAW